MQCSDFIHYTGYDDGNPEESEFKLSVSSSAEEFMKDIDQGRPIEEQIKAIRLSDTLEYYVGVVVSANRLNVPRKHSLVANGKLIYDEISDRYLYPIYKQRIINKSKNNLKNDLKISHTFKVYEDIHKFNTEQLQCIYNGFYFN